MLPRKALIKFNREMSWLLTLFAAVMVLTGYGSTRRIISPFVANSIHLVIGWFFIGLFAFHALVVLIYVPFNWNKVMRRMSELKASSTLWLRIIQRLSGWGVLVLGLLVVLAGLDLYNLGLVSFAQHIRLDVYFVSLLIIHISIGAKFALMRRRIKSPRINNSIAATAFFLIVLVVIINLAPVAVSSPQLQSNAPKEILLSPNNVITIDDKKFNFNPAEVETVKPDLFNPGYFSMFDVLVHLDKNSIIDLEYHFDESMNTYVIDSINGAPNWWYEAYYDGGWSENNVFRMDHYPWKQGTTLRFFRTDASSLNDIYEVHKAEITRKNDNGGKIIIPKVIIRGRGFTEEFTNVEVTPHNLRNDIFREDVITAIDVIMSLGDQGKITYQLKHYESIGSARIVRSYWVETINGETAHDRCGWVYESGSRKYTGFSGNHIHLPSDTRILNSPEYVEYFWICI